MSHSLWRLRSLRPREAEGSGFSSFRFMEPEELPRKTSLCDCAGLFRTSLAYLRWAFISMKGHLSRINLKITSKAAILGGIIIAGKDEQKCRSL